MHYQFWHRVACLLLFLLLVAQAAVADDQVRVTTILEGLDNPTAVAISPNGDLFLAEYGAGRVVRVVGSKTEDVVTGFSDSRPQCLAFIDAETLLVGEGGPADGGSRVREYTVPKYGESIAASESRAVMGPWPVEANAANDSVGVAAMAVLADKEADNTTIYVVSQAVDPKGWVGRVRWSPRKTDFSIEPLLATRELTQVASPAAMTLGLHRRHPILLVANQGGADAAADSVLGFYDLRTSQLLLGMSAGVRDVRAIAYSTRTPQLYAVDFSGSEPTEGGLFRLDQSFVDGKQSIKPKRIVTLERPTSLVFAPNGSLFITVAGPPATDGSSKSGKLLKIDSGL